VLVPTVTVPSASTMTGETPSSMPPLNTPTPASFASSTTASAASETACRSSSGKPPRQISLAPCRHPRPGGSPARTIGPRAGPLHALHRQGNSWTRRPAFHEKCRQRLPSSLTGWGSTTAHVTSPVQHLLAAPPHCPMEPQALFPTAAGRPRGQKSVNR
jgi:hypothetical protein